MAWPVAVLGRSGREGQASRCKARGQCSLRPASHSTCDNLEGVVTELAQLSKARRHGSQDFFSLICEQGLPF